MDRVQGTNRLEDISPSERVVVNNLFFNHGTCCGGPVDLDAGANELSLAVDRVAEIWNTYGEFAPV